MNSANCKQISWIILISIFKEFSSYTGVSGRLLLFVTLCSCTPETRNLRIRTFVSFADYRGVVLFLDLQNFTFFS